MHICYDRKEVYNPSVVGLPYYAVGVQGIRVHNSETIWGRAIGSIKRLFGIGKPTAPGAEPLPGQHTEPVPRALAGATTLDQAIIRYGQNFIGVVEVTPEGTTRVAAGTYGLHENHAGVGKTQLGPVQGPRFGFARQPNGDIWVPATSSAGGIVTEADIPTIRQALRNAGYLIENATHYVWAFEAVDELGNPVGQPRMYNLSTGERL